MDFFPYLFIYGNCIFIRVLDIRVQHARVQFSISPKRLSRALIDLKVIFIDEPQQLELPLHGTITWDPPNPEVRKIIDSKKCRRVGDMLGTPGRYFAVSILLRKHPMSS